MTQDIETHLGQFGERLPLKQNEGVWPQSGFASVCQIATFT